MNVNPVVRTVCLLVAVGVALVLPDVISRGPADMRVLEAYRMVGGRLERVEWLDTANGSTRQRTVGGPSSECPWTIVSDGRLVSEGECAPTRRRFRERDVWYTADFLLARRLLARGSARILGPVEIDTTTAFRVALPRSQNPLMPIRYLDVAPGSMLPLRIVYSVGGRQWGDRVYIRRRPRAAFGPQFFKP